jgi:hypothetical protein
MNIRHINTVEYEEFIVQFVRKIVDSKLRLNIPEIPPEDPRDELGKSETQ